MKVFLSWSGERSKQIAIILRDWLPLVIQSVEPYVSSEDIEKGARWSTDIGRELESTGFGILCVTKDNLCAPWLNFEAGALSKSFETSRTCPFVFDLKKSEVKDSPLLQFQLTAYEMDDVKKLIATLNTACGNEGLDAKRFDRVFDMLWPNLEEQLDKISETNESGDKPVEQPVVSNNAIMEEILDLVRQQYRLLRTPEMVLPASYLNQILYQSRPNISPKLMQDLGKITKKQRMLLERYLSQGQDQIPIEAVMDIYQMTENVLEKVAKPYRNRTLSLYENDSITPKDMLRNIIVQDDKNDIEKEGQVVLNIDDMVKILK